MANAPAALSPAPSMSDGPILKMTGVSKRFPGVLALENVHLEVGPSEIHALLGENGAGKSTLLKMLSGAQSADAGEIELFGKPVAFATPHDAQRAGIVTIYQEFTLAPDMTIAENVFIGREPGSKLFVSWRRMAQETKAIADRIGLKRDPMTAGARSFRRRAAARRDRPRALHAVPAHHHGRADRGFERNRGRKSRPHRAGAEGRGAVDHLCHASAGRGFSSLRSLHRACATGITSPPARSPKPMSRRSSA